MRSDLELFRTHHTTLLANSSALLHFDPLEVQVLLHGNILKRNFASAIGLDENERIGWVDTFGNFQSTHIVIVYFCCLSLNFFSFLGFFLQFIQVYLILNSLVLR